MASSTTRLALTDGVADADEQAVEVIFSRLGDLAALDSDIVDGQLVLGLQLLQVVAERSDVAGNFLLGLLETDDHAGLVVFQYAFGKKGQAKQRLAATGAAADQRASTGG
jgi:hypothetical protein